MNTVLLRGFCSAVWNRTPHITRAYINKTLLVGHRTRNLEARSSGLCLPLCEVSRDSCPPPGLGPPKDLALVLRLAKQETELQPPCHHSTQGQKRVCWLSLLLGLAESPPWTSPTSTGQNRVMLPTREARKRVCHLGILLSSVN